MWCLKKCLFLFVDIGQACDERAHECTTDHRRTETRRNWPEYSEEIYLLHQKVSSYIWAAEITVSDTLAFDDTHSCPAMPKYVFKHVWDQ